MGRLPGEASQPNVCLLKYLKDFSTPMSHSSVALGHRRHLRVVLASPQDVPAERKRVREVIDELNRSHGPLLNIHLDLFQWETDVYPGFHAVDAQAQVDLGLGIEQCDFLIGIFWTRFGSVTTSGETGTEHEIRKAIAVRGSGDKPQILLYFNQKKISPNDLDAEQLKALRRFKSEMAYKGLYWEYNGPQHFQNALRNHLSHWLTAGKTIDPKASREDEPSSLPKTGKGLANKLISAGIAAIFVAGTAYAALKSFKANPVIENTGGSGGDVTSKKTEHVTLLECLPSEEFPAGPLNTSVAADKVASYIRNKYKPISAVLVTALQNFERDPKSLSLSNLPAQLASENVFLSGGTISQEIKERAILRWLVSHSIARAYIAAGKGDLGPGQRDIAEKNFDAFYKEMLDQALTLAPNSASLLLFRAAHHLDLEETPLAEQDYRTAINLLDSLGESQHLMRVKARTDQLICAINLASQQILKLPVAQQSERRTQLAKSFDTSTKSLRNLLSSPIQLPTFIEARAYYQLGQYSFGISNNLNQAWEDLGLASNAVRNIPPSSSLFSDRLLITTEYSLIDIRRMREHGIINILPRLSDLSACAKSMLDAEDSGEFDVKRNAYIAPYVNDFAYAVGKIAIFSIVFGKPDAEELATAMRLLRRYQTDSPKERRDSIGEADVRKLEFQAALVTQELYLATDPSSALLNRIKAIDLQTAAFGKKSFDREVTLEFLFVQAFQIIRDGIQFRRLTSAKTVGKNQSQQKLARLRYSQMLIYQRRAGLTNGSNASRLVDDVKKNWKGLLAD